MGQLLNKQDNEIIFITKLFLSKLNRYITFYITFKEIPYITMDYDITHNIKTVCSGHF